MLLRLLARKVGLVFRFGVWGAALSLAGVAQAQELEEVIVTAQKRAESVQDVPIAMTALTADDLRGLTLGNSVDLARAVPSLEWIDDGTRVPQIFIRGVGDVSFHLNQQGGVGMYMDEVALNSPVLRGAPLYDLERVEVLRGPQNTLFGLNTTGGAIQLISRKPRIGKGLNGYANVSYGSLETASAEAAVGFAAGETAALRLAISGTRQQDWKDNVTLGRKIGEYKQLVGRAQFLWKPTDSLDVLLNVHAGSKNGDRTPDLSFGSRNPMNPAVVDPGCAFEVGNGCADSTGYLLPRSWDKVASNLVGQDDYDVSGGFVNLSWQLPTVTVTSLTAIESAAAKTYGDSDGGPNNILMFSQEADTEQWSQEIRVTSNSAGPLRWIGGLYYFHEDADWATALRFTPPPAFATFGPRNQGPQNVPNTIVSQDNDVWSAYGQLEFDLSEKLTLTTGLRYTNESKEADIAAVVGVWTAAQLPADHHIGFDEIKLLTAGLTPILGHPDKSWSEFGGKVSLDYRFSDDLLLYASASRGFKGGGTSVAAGESISGFPGRTVEPEILWSYEMGAKSSWLANRMNLNLALFYNDWTDQQLFTTAVLTNVISTFLINVPKTRTYGAELEWKLSPGAGWLLSAGLTLLDGEVREAGPEFPAIRAGNSLPNSPDVTLKGLIRKDWPLGGGLLTLQTSFSYKDDVQYDISENPVLHEGKYWLVNARSSYRFGADGKYEIALSGDNLGGTKYCKQRTDNVAGNNFGGTGRCAANPGETLVSASLLVSF